MMRTYESTMKGKSCESPVQVDKISTQARMGRIWR